MANPLTQVYDALWTLLSANAALVTLIPEANWIRYTGDVQKPDSEESKHETYPKLRIREATGQVHLHRSSSGTSYKKRYQIQVATDDERLLDMHDIEYQILRAMANWPTVMDALQWDVDDTYFAKTFKVLATEQSLYNKELNQNENHRGWGTIWACEVEMWFDTSALIVVT